MRKILRNEEGVSAIEFALIAPILLLILAAVVDFGALIFVRSQLESAVSGATGYALSQGQALDTQSAPSLTLAVAKTLASQAGDNALVDVTINNGPRVTGTANGLTQAGTTALAGLCYCPRREQGEIVWGNSLSCGSSCSGGGIASKYMSLKASLPYSPIFYNYGLVDSGQIVVRALAVLQ